MSLLFSPYFRAADQVNAPIAGAFLSFYATQTSTPQPIYADFGLTIPLTNPVQADGNGVFSAIWLDDSLPPYKVVLQYPDVNNPAIPGAIVAGPNGTLDPYNSTFSATAVNQLIHPQIQAETDAGVTVVDFAYPPLYVDRYAKNLSPGTTVMTTAWQAAINVAKKQGGVVRWGVGPYLIDAELDLTNKPGSQNCMFALIGEGKFKAPTNTIGQPATPSIILKHTIAGNAFDTTGSLGVHFENMSICTDEVAYPKTCFLLARNTDGSSRTDRIINCYVLGRFSRTILYNYGAENGTYLGNQFYNIAADDDISTFDITGFNARVLSSNFTSISVGSQSCLDHKIISGEYATLFQGSGTTCDAFRFDGARSVKIVGIWVDCSAKANTSSGRSLFYIDGRHSPAQLFTFIGVNGEAAPFPAFYGFFFTADPVVHSNIVVIGCSIPNGQYMVGGGTSATLTQLTWLNNTNESQGGGINFTGTMLAPWQVDFTANITGSPILNNETWNTNQGIRLAGEANYTLTDTTQAVGKKGWRVRNSSTSLAMSRLDDNGNVTADRVIVTDTGLGFNNTAAIAKPTVTGSRGSNAALASLITALANYGLITDSSS